jgi:hypothetical protein
LMTNFNIIPIKFLYVFFWFPHPARMYSLS